jgi:hypothetical protein
MQPEPLTAGTTAADGYGDVDHAAGVIEQLPKLRGAAVR